MKLITLCAIFSALLAVSLASPIKVKNRDMFNSSDSSESSESQNVEKNSSSSEEEGKYVQKLNYHRKDSNEENNSADISEEQLDKKTVIKDEFTGHHSVEEKETERNKRAVDFASHPKNQLSLKDEDLFKYNKHLKLKGFKVALESNESQDSQNISPRLARSADTSEESSSEEDKKGKDHGAHKHSATPDEKSNDTPTEGNVVAKTLDNAPVKTLSLAAKAESSRRKRNLEYSSEEDQSVQEISKNEVFIFSNEKQDSEEDLQNINLKDIEDFVLNDQVLKELEKTPKTKNSEEDYAQGCGSHSNQDDDSNESTNDNNETLFDKL